MEFDTEDQVLFWLFLNISLEKGCIAYSIELNWLGVVKLFLILFYKPPEMIDLSVNSALYG